MGYGQLYEHRQSLPPYINRNKLLALVHQFSGERATYCLSGLITIDTIRGLFFQKEAAARSRFKSAAKGCHLIVCARANNRCWRRFVLFKELMHLFDDPSESVDNADKFESLINEFAQPGVQATTPAYKSEGRAFWMALGLITTEERRAQLADDRVNGRISDYEIAKELRIPEQCVPFLCGDKYRACIEAVLKDK